MKKFGIISSLFAILLVFAACEKEQFNRCGEQDDPFATDQLRGFVPGQDELDDPVVVDPDDDEDFDKDDDLIVDPDEDEDYDTDEDGDVIVDPDDDEDYDADDGEDGDNGH